MTALLIMLREQAHTNQIQRNSSPCLQLFTISLTFSLKSCFQKGFYISHLCLCMNQIAFCPRELGTVGVLQLLPVLGKKEEGREELQLSPLRQKLMIDNSSFPPAHSSRYTGRARGIVVVGPTITNLWEEGTSGSSC